MPDFPQIDLSMVPDAGQEDTYFPASGGQVEPRRGDFGQSGTPTSLEAETRPVEPRQPLGAMPEIDLSMVPDEPSRPSLAEQLQQVATRPGPPDPLAATKLERYSQATGLDPVAVAQDPELSQAASQMTTLDLPDYARKYPGAAAFLVQGNNYLKAQADIEAMGWWERKLGALREGLKDVARNAAGSLQGYAEAKAAGMRRWESTGTPPWAQDTKMAKMGIGPSMPPAPWLVSSEQSTSAAQTFEAMVESEILKTDPAYQGKSSGFIEDVFRGAPQLGLQALVTVLTGPVSGMAFIGAQISGAQYLELRAAGVDPERAMSYATWNAALQAPLEQLALGKALAVWKPQKAIIQRVRKLFEAGATEFATEFLQAFPEAATTLLAKNPDTGILDDMRQYLDQVPEIASQGAYEGAIAATLAAVLGLPSMAIRTPPADQTVTGDDVQREAEATQAVNTEAQAQQAEVARESAGQVLGLVREGWEQFNFAKDKTTFRQYLKQMEETYGLPEEMHIKASKLQEAMQASRQQGLNEGDVAEILETFGLDEEQFSDAVRLDLPIALPTEAAATLLDNPAGEQIIPNLSFSPADAQDFDLKGMDALFQSAAPEQSTDQAERFSQDLQTRAGYSKSEADVLSKIVDVRARRWSEMTGRSAAEYWETRGFHVEHPSEASSGDQLNQGPINTDTPEFRNWFGGSGVVDEQGQPLVVYHGTESDFEAFDRAYLGTGTADNASETSLAETARLGFFFNSSPMGASETRRTFFNRDMPVYLKIENAYKFGSLVELANYIQELGDAENAKADLERQGHDGVSFIDEEFGGTSFVAFSPTQIKSIYNRGTFDPNDPRILYQGERGYTRFNEQNQAILGFFRGRDLSTGLHEIGHVFNEDLKELAAMPDADPRTIADWQALNDWVGARAGDTWTVEQKEKFARGFEAYLREGKAPSRELQPIFSRIRKALLDIYRNIRQLDVELTPEVRRVFDRLLATDEEIREAREQAGLQPLFDAAGPAPQGVSPDVWTAYQQSVRDANMSMQGAVDKHQLAERAELEAEWRRDGRELASQHPDQQLFRNLEQAGGLSQESVSGLTDPTGLAKIRRKRPGLIRRGGQDLNLLAAQEGLGPEALVDRLLDAPTQKQLVDQYVADQLAAWEAEWNASDAVLTDESLAMMAMEETVLAEMTGRKNIPDIQDPNLRERIRETVNKTQVRKILTERTKYEAAQRRWDTAVRRAIRGETQEIRAEERARAGERVAQEQQRGQDRLQAERDRADMREYKAGARTQQRLDRQAARYEERLENQRIEARRAAVRRREAAAYRKELADARKYLAKTRRYFKRVVKNKAIAPDYQVRIRELLSKYDPSVRTSRIMKRRESLREFVERQQEAGEAVNIPQRLIDMAYATTFGEMTLDEVKELRSAVENLEHVGKTKQRLLGAKRDRTIAQAEEDLTTGAYRNRKTRLPKTFEQATGLTGWLTALKDFGSRVNADLIKMEFVCHALDGFRATGPWRTYIFNPFVAAENEKLALGAKLVQGIQGAMNNIPKEMRRGWTRARITIPGSKIKLTREQMFMVGLNAGNRGNWTALREGYREIGGWTDETIQGILDMLTPAEVQAIQGVWDTVNSLYARLDKAHMDLFGTHMSKVEGWAVNFGQVGEVQGAYFPLVFDRRLSWRAEKIKQASEAELAQMFKNIYRGGSLESGFTKERTGGKMPPRLDTSVITRHIHDATLWATHATAVRDVQVMLRRPAVRDAVVSTFGEAYYRKMIPWIAHIARPETQLDTYGQYIARFLRRNTTLVMLGLKASVALKQFGSFTQTIKELGVKDSMAGLARMMTHPRSSVEFMFANSEFMRQRRKSWDREAAQQFGSGRAFRLDVRQKMANAFMWPIGAVDLVTAGSTWLSAYRVGLKKNGFSHDQAVQYADQIVRTTQPSATPKDLAGVQREGGEFQKAMTMFYTFFSVAYNQQWAAASRFRQQPKSIRSFVTLARDVWWLVIAAALYGQLVSGDIPDEDDWYGGKSVVNYMAAGIPHLRDGVNAMVSGYDYTVSPIMEGYRSLDRLKSSFTSDEFDEWRATKSALDVVGYTFGLPSKQISKTLEGAAQLGEGDTENPLVLLFGKERNE